MFVKGIETLDKIKYPKGLSDDTALFHDIIEAESFMRPMLEANGYHALAAELDSTCKIHRINKMDRSDLVEEAAKIYEKWSKVDPGEIAQKMFGLKERPEVTWIVNETGDTTTGINCRFAETIVTLPSGQKGRLKFRQKSIGSIAYKLFVKQQQGIDDYEMMDIMGFTLVVGDEAHKQDAYRGMSPEDVKSVGEVQTNILKDNFSAIVKHAMQEDSGINLASPRKEKRPVHFQGTADFIKSVGAFDTQARFGDDIVGVKSYDNGRTVYQVAKYTGFVDVLVSGVLLRVPTELQWATHYDHVQSRIGLTSHEAYEATKQNKDTYHDDATLREEIASTLDAINKGRLNLNKPNRYSCLLASAALLRVQMQLTA